MKNRISIGSATFLVLAGVFALLAPLGACVPPSEGPTGTGGTSGGGSSGSTGQAGNAGRAGSAGTGGVLANCSAGGSTGGGSDKANWESVREIVDLTCQGADCHADREPLLFAPAGRLNDADLYAKLTTHTSAKCGNRVLVKPCYPEESAFYLVQRPDACGPGSVAMRMPFGCVDGCTPDNYLEGVRQWIAKGAPRQ